MTNLVKHHKVVSSLPASLEASSIYYVRVGNGFDMYVTNSSGGIVKYQMNMKADLVRIHVRNQTGSTLFRDTVVYVNGVGGGKPLVFPAQANSKATSSGILGILQDDIPTNSNGYAIISGELVGIDTSDLSEGDILWLSPTTAGSITLTKPSAPNRAVYIGIVTRSHINQGSVLVQVMNGFELEELHNVAITSPTDGQVLAYESATGLWKNIDVSTDGSSGSQGKLYLFEASLPYNCKRQYSFDVSTPSVLLTDNIFGSILPNLENDADFCAPIRVIAEVKAPNVTRVTFYSDGVFGGRFKFTLSKIA